MYNEFQLFKDWHQRLQMNDKSSRMRRGKQMAQYRRRVSVADRDAIRFDDMASIEENAATDYQGGGQK